MGCLDKSHEEEDCSQSNHVWIIVKTIDVLSRSSCGFKLNEKILAIGCKISNGFDKYPERNRAKIKKKLELISLCFSGYLT